MMTNMSLLYVEIIVLIVAAFLAGLFITWSFTGRQSS
jgi:hypothetical protein